MKRSSDIFTQSGDFQRSTLMSRLYTHRHPRLLFLTMLLAITISTLPTAQTVYAHNDNAVVGWTTVVNATQSVQTLEVVAVTGTDGARLREEPAGTVTQVSMVSPSRSTVVRLTAGWQCG
ncbi:MAG: hypothetical protein R2932_23585 [Caldilineaceae bacterium]